MISLLFVSGCSNSLSSSLPETQIIAEEPIIIGHITRINNEDQVFQVVENISKKKALNGVAKDEGYWVQLNGITIDQKLAIGNKVAVWDSPTDKSHSIEERKAAPIGKHIVLLEK